MLLGSLMPSVSHLLRASGSDSWVEVCSSLGSKWVSAADPERSGSKQAPLTLKALDHCAYCTLQANAMGMPPDITTAVFLPQGRFDVPRLFLLAARTQFAWASAQPRAPPQNS
jgi:hypothetical protein